MIKLILLGAGGHCESVIEVIEALTSYKIQGILDPIYSEFNNHTILGYPIIGNDDKIEEFIKKGFEFVITVGQIKSPKIRKSLFQTVKSKGGRLPVIIASTAYVSKNCEIGEGTVIMNFAMLNSNVLIGSCNIINTFSDIEHGCNIGNFNHISTRVTLNGEVIVENESFIGSGTIVNEGCSIGNNVIIGSGSLVRKNLTNNSLAYGNPIQIIKV
jgi:sugar O-acyltransferase (sialic acid O-acetyltransferase NeuD family)